MNSRRTFYLSLSACIAFGVLGLGAVVLLAQPRHGVTGTGASGSSSVASLPESEAATATFAAITEALRTVPGTDRASDAEIQADARSGTWPSNVSEASAIATTAGDAQKYVGSGDTGDQTPALVVELEGKFQVITTGPNVSSNSAGAVSNGNVLNGGALILVVNAETGAVTDYGVAPAASDFVALSDPVVLYEEGK